MNNKLIDINQIKFGNMSQQCMYWISQTTSYLDKHYSDLNFFSNPANSSNTTIDELNNIALKINEIKDKPVLKTYLDLDRLSFNLYRNIINQTDCITDKKDINNMLDAIIADCSPLIYRLKQNYGRPRPNQLAAIYKLNLYPHQVLADSPSYPSASVYFSNIICAVIGNHYPETYANMQRLFDDVCKSRIALGCNYDSDIEVAILAAEKVLDDPEFKVKYKL